MPPSLAGLQATIEGLVASGERIDDTLDDLRKEMQVLQRQLHDLELLHAEDSIRQQTVDQFRKAVGAVSKRLSRVERRLAVDKPWVNLWVKFLIAVLIFATGLVANWLVGHMLRQP